jgi:hypothetical protein
MSDAHSSTTPPAGWYADARIPGQERWWDGLDWRQHTRLAPPGSPLPEKRDAEYSHYDKGSTSTDEKSGGARAGKVAGGVLAAGLAVAAGVLAKRRRQQ